MPMPMPMSLSRRIANDAGMAEGLVDGLAPIGLATVLATAAGEPVDGDDEHDDGVNGGDVVHVYARKEGRM